MKLQNPSQLLAILLGLAFSGNATAQTATWTGGSGGEWNTTTSWDIGVPGPGTNAVIPASTTVNYSSPMLAASFGRLALLGSLNVGANGFVLDAKASTSPVIGIATNATLNVTANGVVTVTNAGGAIWVTNGGTLAISANGVLVATNSTGAASLNVGSSGNPSKGGTVNVLGTLTLDQVLSVAGTPGRVFVNGGMLNCLGGSKVAENNNDGGCRIAVSGGGVANLGDFSVYRTDNTGGLLLTNGVVNASVVSHKRLELFFLCFWHSGTGAAGFDPLQCLFAPA